MNITTSQTRPQPVSPRVLRRSLQARCAWTVTLAGAALLGGCATTSGPANPQDPLESFNRSMFSFNDSVDRAVVKPVATAYRAVTPEFARQGVGNFFNNLGEVWNFANNALQGRGEGAYNSVVRFTVNSVFGVGGLIDVASEAGIARHKQDFGQTLGRWGVPTGPYLVLPLLGPTTVRDTVALPVDWYGDVVGYVDDIPWRNSLYGIRLLNRRAQLLSAGETLDNIALDKYSLMRDVYLRSRVGSKAATAGGDGKLPDYDGNDGKLPPEGDDGSYGGVVPLPFPLLRK